MTESHPAIVVIGYNRPKSIERLLNKLNSASYPVDDIPLIISIDRGNDENNSQVLQIANEFNWKYGTKKVIFHEHNLGLRNHTLLCGDFSIEYGAAIVFEDDVYPSEWFYSYVLQSLDFYKNDDRVLAISLYSQDWNGYAGTPFEPLYNGYDVHISQIECSWGECFIGTQWKAFREWYETAKDSELKVNPEIPYIVYTWSKSWSKYIINYMVEKSKYYVIPYFSHSSNYSDLGEHEINVNTDYQVPLVYGDKKYVFPTFEQALHYDIYFESQKLKDFLSRKMDAKCCIDFLGIRKNYDGYDFLLSKKELPYKIVDSYGMTLRPWETNVYDNVDGNDIYLYDLKIKAKSLSKWKRKYHKVKYQIKSVKWSDAIFYGLVTRFYAHKK